VGSLALSAGTMYFRNNCTFTEVNNRISKKSKQDYKNVLAIILYRPILNFEMGIIVEITKCPTEMSALFIINYCSDWAGSL